ncbi:ATP-binding cassette domain-containing protein [Candidatus Woesearchaeota archaeon]|nr:ATP-binding cassette domain-containing protein [Candidatus Woesearchaeota archaeon]
MLELINLKAGYDNLNVINKISLNIKKKKITLLIGPNGAGKSTLIKTIFKLAKISQGKIIFNKKDITKIPTNKLSELGIVYMPQNMSFFSELTVFENLIIAGRKSDIKEFDVCLLKVFTIFPELKKNTNKISTYLSGGQQQMLAIAIAIMQRPKLLILDEPTKGLSPKIVSGLLNKIVEIKKLGITILMIEQNVKKAIEFSDNVVILENGKIIWSGKKEQLNKKKLRHLYLGGNI